MADDAAKTVNDLIEREKARIKEAADKIAALERFAAEAARLGLAVVPLDGASQAPVIVPEALAPAPRLTIKDLIARFSEDEQSSFAKLRHGTRRQYSTLHRRIASSIGDLPVSELDARRLRLLHDEFKAGGKVALAHSLMTQMRILASYGTLFLKDDDAQKLKLTLSDMEFETPKPRIQKITENDILSLRAQAHEMDRPSIALAQAFQWDCRLRQKEVIGEWVPLSEQNFISDIHNGKKKWGRGLRWEFIVDDVLEHETSTGNAPFTFALKDAPMVREELARTRNRKPSGPMIVNELTGLPWDANEYRRVWRQIADAAGLSKELKNGASRLPPRNDLLPLHLRTGGAKR